MAKFRLRSFSVPCFRNKWEALEYGCDFYNKTKVALKELQNNHRWWNRFSSIDISWKVYIKLRSTVNLISTFFWVSFYSHGMKVKFFPFTLLSICKILNYDEQKINECYHLISKCFRFGKEGNNQLSLKCWEESWNLHLFVGDIIQTLFSKYLLIYLGASVCEAFIFCNNVLNWVINRLSSNCLLEISRSHSIYNSKGTKNPHNLPKIGSSWFEET